MNTFVLNRTEDETGISGTGIVAEGIEFSNGKVVLCWIVGDSKSVSVWDCIEDAIAIHGHGGKTLVQWDTEDGPAVSHMNHEGDFHDGSRADCEEC